MESTLKPAVFFDRDGVLNHDAGYIHRIEDFCWMKGAKEAVALCRKYGYEVFVVTNQSGIARGLYTEKEVEILHNHMETELEKEGTFVTAFAYCPHHPEGVVEKYRKECTCRKPNPGMLLDLMKEYCISPEKSFMVGDRESDMEAAEKAGITPYLFSGLDIYEFMEAIFEKKQKPYTK